MSKEPRPPYFELLLRASLWTPVTVLLSLALLLAWGVVFIALVLAGFCLYAGDWRAAALWALAGGSRLSSSVVSWGGGWARLLRPCFDFGAV